MNKSHANTNARARGKKSSAYLVAVVAKVGASVREVTRTLGYTYVI
jgi:hypothetical protein